MIFHAYIRVAKDTSNRRNPIKVEIGLKPDEQPLFKSTGYGSKTFLPTTAFSVEFHIPDEAFNRAERLAGRVQVREEDIIIGINTNTSHEDEG